MGSLEPHDPDVGHRIVLLGSVRTMAATRGVIPMAPVTTQRIIRILANTACLHSWKSGNWARLGMTQWDTGTRRPVPWRQETRFSNICSKVKGDQAVSAFFFPWESQEMSESLLTWFSRDCSDFIIGFEQLHSWTGYIFSDHICP